jgi:vancomycin resistance protein YoaR/uncharacterized membrane protein
MNESVYKKRKSITDHIKQIIVILSINFATILIVVLAAVGVYQGRFEGRILIGVSVSGIDLSGLTIDEASKKITEVLNYPLEGKITFIDGDRQWEASPIELGLLINNPETIRHAYQAGRDEGFINNLVSQLRAYLNGVDLPAMIIYDERVASGYLNNIASQIDMQVVEADLYLDGIQVISSNGKIGRILNIDKTLNSLSVPLKSFQNDEIQLVVEEIHPAVLNVDTTAATLRKILDSPLVIKLPNQSVDDPGPWLIEPSALSNMLKIEKIFSDESAEFQVGIYESQFIPLLNEIGDSIERNSQNAKFIFNDNTRQLDLIQNSLIGRKLNLDDTLKNIREAINRGSDQIEIAMDINDPKVGDNVTAAELGITELVSSVSTYFWGSSNERIQNIQTASSRFHGILVAPGETFSMSDALGDISLDNGYAEALIIYDNRTIAGVGGGVCQVSTTLFRTVFLGGYPVVERHPHAYRVGYYEQTYSGAKDSKWAGLDATVYVPLVDFKFTNDSQYWLLMETYVNVQARSLTWKFYSTNDGRSVQWNTTGLNNIKPAPDPIFQENQDLGLNVIKQVDWSADGADVTITRTVTKNGQLYFEDKYVTSYEPWQAICQYGAGVSDPEKKAAEKGICQ